MPKFTPGNRLYFYQLFSTQMGVGKQTALQRVEEILAEADVLLDDVECETIEELLDALSDFMKLTVFKKGRVFVTVMPRDDLDELLEKAAQSVAEKAPAGAGMSSWKRARRSKDIRPMKPRHRRPPARKVVETAATAAVETAMRAETAVGEATDKIEARELPAEEATDQAAAMVETQDVSPEGIPVAPEPQEAPEPEAAPKPEAAPEPEPATEVAPSTEPEVAAEPEVSPEPEAAPEPSSSPEPIVEAVPSPEADASTAPEAVSADTPQEPEHLRAAPEPSITFNITYVPTDVQEAPELEVTVEEVEPVSEPPIARCPSARKPLRAVNLPEVLSDDVFFPDYLLLKLYQALPDTVGLLETLDESWEFARQAGTAEGSRTRLSFPLSRVIEGQLPIEVTIERAARLTSGKGWKLVDVDTGDEDEAEDSAIPLDEPLEEPADEPDAFVDEA